MSVSDGAASQAQTRQHKPYKTRSVPMSRRCCEKRRRSGATKRHSSFHKRFQQILPLGTSYRNSSCSHCSQWRAPSMKLPNFGASVARDLLLAELASQRSYGRPHTRYATQAAFIQAHGRLKTEPTPLKASEISPQILAHLPAKERDPLRRAKRADKRLQ